MIFFETRITWSQMVGLKSTTALKVGYLGAIVSPLYAYFVNALNEYMNEDFLAYPNSFFWVFFGSLTLSIAHVLNEVLCPPIISKYLSLDEYRSSIASNIMAVKEIASTSEDFFRKKLSEKIRRSSNSLSEEEARILINAVAIQAGKIFQEKSIEDFFHLDFKEKWDKENSSLMYVRITIALLYFASAVISIYLITLQLMSVILASDVFG